LLSITKHLGFEGTEVSQHLVSELLRLFVGFCPGYFVVIKVTGETNQLTGYLDRESHYLWGKRYLLEVVERTVPPNIELEHDRIVLQVRYGATNARKEVILEAWYRDRLREAIPALIEKWEPLTGVKVARFFVQRMKTKWGSCNTRTRNIRLNSELAKKPRECLEHVLVHELVHLLEPTHNHRFIALMDQFMPKWRFYRDELNRLPVRHETWVY